MTISADDNSHRSPGRGVLQTTAIPVACSAGSALIGAPRMLVSSRGQEQASSILSPAARDDERLCRSRERDDHRMKGTNPRGTIMSAHLLQLPTSSPAGRRENCVFMTFLEHGNPEPQLNSSKGELISRILNNVTPTLTLTGFHWPQCTSCSVGFSHARGIHAHQPL